MATRANCSVLIARTKRVEHLILATDAMQADEVAERITRWPLFRSIPAVANRVDAACGLDYSTQLAIRTGSAPYATERRAAPALAVASADGQTQDIPAGLSKDDLVVVGTRPDPGCDEHTDGHHVRELAGFEGSVLFARS